MKLENLLIDAVERAIYDVDKKHVALQISGGLDSAIIQAIGRFDNLYCCTWPNDGVDNLELANLAAMGRDVTPVTFAKQEMIDVLPVVSRLTNGKGSWSQVCQWFLCRAARADGAQVILTGEGADEYFGGYTRYKILHHIEQCYSDPKLSAYQGISTLLLGDRRDVMVKLASRTMSRREAESIVPRDLDHNNLVKDMASVEQYYCLPTLIQHGSSMAGYHGISPRYPFADCKLIDYAHNLSPSQMVNDEFTKVALRRAAEKLGVHPRIIHEKTKRGLFIPQSWAPPSEQRWSRGWFQKLLEEAA